MGERALSALLPQAAVGTGIAAADRFAAVRAAGDLLVAAGAATPAYTDQMCRVLRENGPYIVLAPGLALAHARPSDAVLRTRFSWAGLSEPVEFGHPEHDPVRLVVGLAARDHHGHAAALARLARLLTDPERRSTLLAAEEPQTVRSAIAEFERESAP